MKVIRIGGGSSYATDRISPARELAEKGKLHYLGLTTLAERTIGLAQLRKFKDPTHGYNELLDDRWYALLPVCKEKGFKVITDMGAANPIAAMNRTSEVIKELNLTPWKIAAVTGDDVSEYIMENKTQLRIMDEDSTVADLDGQIIAANAYIGAEPIVEALEKGAHIVITGRTADPSLFLAPMIHEFGWKLDDWQVLGAGQAAADMIECSGIVTGGWFADPGYIEVPDLARLGYPLLEVSPNGEVVVTKVEGSGGLVSVPNCTQQMLYEVHDPANYITPDVVVDFTNVKLKQVGKDMVKISGARGKPAPSLLKVSIAVLEGFIGEGMITYAGLGCVERAKATEQLIRKRLETENINIEELRVDYIGINSLHGEASLPPSAPPYEVRLRVAARTKTRKDAERLGNEVGSCSGRGVFGGIHGARYVKEVLAVYPTLIPREVVKPKVTIKEVL